MAVGPDAATTAPTEVNRISAESEAGAEAQAHEDESRLIEAQRLAKVGDWEWDLATGAITWSPQTYAMFGRSPLRSPPTYEELRGYYAPASWGRLDAAVKRALDSGVAYELELEHVREDGVHAWHLARGEAVRHATGRIVGLRGTAQDITERRRVEEALRESEERSRLKASELETVLDTVPAAVWISRDPRGDRIDANRFGAELLRRRTGDNVSITSPGEDRPRHFTAQRGGRILAEDELPVQRAARTGVEVRDVEFDVVFDDGEVRHLLGNSAPLRDADGRVKGSVAAFIDVTERKRAEARSESLARFPRENPDPSLRLDASFQVVYANPAALAGMAELGLEASGAAPGPLAELARRALAERRLLTEELTCGGVVFAVRVVPVGEEVNIYAQDITARKHAEDALARSEERARAKAAEAQEVVEKLEATFSAMTQGVIVFGADGKVVRMNSAAETILGPDLRFKEAPSPEVGVPLLGLRTPGGAPFPVEDTPAWRALHGESSRDVEMAFRRPSGELVWLSASGAPIRSADGRLAGAVVTFSDVTDQKRAERALLEANEQLRQADRRKTEFLGVLSHELRNPLAPIRNSIHILERVGPDSEQGARAREIVRRQTEHLTRLVDDLLDVMRIEHGRIVLQRTRVDLREIIRQTTDDVRAAFAGAGVELHVEHVLGPVWLDADATRIAQAVGNLLHNAVKFTPRGGTVTLSLRATADEAEVRVRDSGPGIDAAMMSRLFVPFVQGEQTLARTSGGLGLGLALVKGLVELHGGAVEARSDGLGTGAEFLIRLPVAGPAKPAGEPHLDPLHPKGRLILVIEDNVDAAETLADLLRLEGHEVRIAHDGRSGLELARAVRPDVVLCDIGLPDIDGYEVARALRRDEALRGTRLVAVTGYTQPEDRQRAREAGFDAHVAKPPDPDELLKVLAADGAGAEHAVRGTVRPPSRS